MVGMDHLAKSLRQTDDAGTTMIGGVSAGGMLSMFCKSGGMLGMFCELGGMLDVICNSGGMLCMLCGSSLLLSCHAL